MYKDRNKAFLGAIIGAGVGVGKGIAGIISKRKQAQKQQQQDYLNAVMQSVGGMNDEINANEDLENQFESKYVMKCGGRKRACYGKASKMACGGRKKAQLGAIDMNNTGTFTTTQNLDTVNVTAKAPTRTIKGINIQPKTIDINAENAKLQTFANNVGQSNMKTVAPAGNNTSPTGGVTQMSGLIGTTENAAGKVEAALAGIGAIGGTISNATGLFKCGGRKKAMMGFSTGMQLGSMVGDIGQAFVKAPKHTDAIQTQVRTNGLTNLSQPVDNTQQANVVVDTNVATPNTQQLLPGQSASPINPKQMACGGKKAKFGTSRRRCGLGIRQAYKSSRK